MRRMKDWEEKKRGLDEMCTDLNKLSVTEVAMEVDEREVRSEAVTVLERAREMMRILAEGSLTAGNQAA